MIYTAPFKLNSIRRCKNEQKSIGDIAREEHIPKQTLARWIKIYNLKGKKGLDNRKTGVKEAPINQGFERLVLNAWNKRKRSVYMMRKDLRKDIRRNGYAVSESHIRKIYRKHKLTDTDYS